MAMPQVEDRVGKRMQAIIIDNEMATAVQNQREENLAFEAMIDMLECLRAEKDYAWMSDIFIPEYPSHVLTTSAIDASQYFMSRDFVSAFLMDEKPASLAKAAAASENINRTLNQDHLFYYQKFMRGRIISDMAGKVYLRCWWEKQEREIVLGYKVDHVPSTTHDIFGQPLEEGNQAQIPRSEAVYTPQLGTEPIIDRFNFDVLDNRNVFTSPEYCYSIQQKKWITIRFPKTYNELRVDQKQMGYENLDQLKKVKPPTLTKAQSEADLKDIQKRMPTETPDRSYDIIERWGQFWCKVTKYRADGEPIEIEPGIDDAGEPLEGEDIHLLETVITYAVSDSTRVLIRFQLNPYRDPFGLPYKPFVRGLCFIHPTKDGGMGDGIFSREMQKAINDTFNLTMDRTKLAMLPTLIGDKNAVEDNTTIYFAPEHTMEVEGGATKLEVFKIEDNIEGGLRMLGLLIDKSQQIKSSYPTTMGNVPAESSTTATAVAGADAKSTTRANYRSLTDEHTRLSEFYRMINWMTYQFAHEETAKKLLGDKMKDFDPKQSYMWKPVSSAIETEYGKANKVRNLLTMLSYVAKIPAMAPLIVYIMIEVFKAYGDEYAALKDKIPGMKQLEASIQGANGGAPDGNNGGGSPDGQNATAGAPSNQNGMPIQDMEGATREATQEAPAGA